MISLRQRRMTIGCFHSCNTNIKAYCRNTFTNRKYSFHGSMSFILFSIILSLLLVIAGDVELNPGPSRKCPHCEFEIPISLKKRDQCGLLVKSFKS